MPEATKKRITESLNAAITEQEDQIETDRTYLQQLIDTRTRDYIATLVAKAFFFLLAVILIGVQIYNANVGETLRLSLSELLQQYASVLGPILGFVIGYYFKTKND